MARSGDSFDPAKTPGAFGEAPPGAPQQIADNTNIGPTAEQIRQARMNEQELAPLTFKDSVAPPAAVAASAKPVAAPAILGPDGQPAAPAAIPGTTESPIVPAGGLPNTSSFKPVDRPLSRRSRLLGATKFVDQPAAAAAAEPRGEEHGTGTGADGDRSGDHRGGDDAAGAGSTDHAAGAAGSDPAQAAQVVANPAELGRGTPPIELPKRHDDLRGRPDPTSPLAAAARMLTEKDLRAADPSAPYRPAESNSDSPSRGIPQPIADPGKKITGGFGDMGDAQYYPLDGNELRELVYALLDQLHARLLDDLRFSMAVTYPRVAARVVVEIQAFAQPKVEIQAVMPPHAKTPLEVAREISDEVVFVVVAERAEMTADGQSIAPPNQTRQDLGLEVPRKRMVRAGAATLMVDREP